MKIAIYTLTRDRLEYTRRSFTALHELAGHPFDHFVVDNGSEDGTQAWLTGNAQVADLCLLNENVGISAGSNQALNMIAAAGDYDLICKMDNDCILNTPAMLVKLLRVFNAKRGGREYFLSPRVVGINRQPERRTSVRLNGIRLGWVGQIGGLFHATTGSLYQAFRYNEHLPKAWGQDEDICTWMHGHGVQIGYVEELEVEHCDTTDGQVAKYPAYFERKWGEENL